MGHKPEKYDPKVVRACVRRAFNSLRKMGYFCRMNFWCCQNCAVHAIASEKGPNQNYVFYHNQDNTSLEEGHGLFLAWSGDDAVIVAALTDAGLKVEHEMGNREERIYVSGVTQAELEKLYGQKCQNRDAVKAAWASMAKE